MNVKGAISELAPNGVLRAGINLSNFLLVTGKDSSGAPVGVAPDMARAIADRLEVDLALTTFSSPGELADADNDLSLDFEVDEASPSKTNEALDDLLDLDEEPEADLDSHLAADLADSADESDDDLPELTFDTEESAEVEVSDSTQDGVVEETSTEDVADENERTI
mgnify:CR=1 FL=1